MKCRVPRSNLQSCNPVYQSVTGSVAQHNMPSNLATTRMSSGIAVAFDCSVGAPEIVAAAAMMLLVAAEAAAFVHTEAAAIETAAEAAAIVTAAAAAASVTGGTTGAKVGCTGFAGVLLHALLVVANFLLQRAKADLDCLGKRSLHSVLVAEMTRKCCLVCPIYCWRAAAVYSACLGCGLQVLACFPLVEPRRSVRASSPFQCVWQLQRPARGTARVAALLR